MTDITDTAFTESDSLRSIMAECEGRRFGQRGYDITLDHIYDCAEVALAELERERTQNAAMRDAIKHVDFALGSDLTYEGASKPNWRENCRERLRAALSTQEEEA